MPIDKTLVQQIRAASKKPRNFLFVPGDDYGFLTMSTRKFSAAQISEAKQMAGPRKVIKGLTKVVNGELVFENTTNEDKPTESKLRRTLKLRVGLIQPMHLVKVAKVQEVDEDDRAAVESAKLTDAEQEGMRQAEYKQRRTEVARQVDRLRELMPEALGKLAPLMQEIAALETEEDYKKGLAKVEKLEGLVLKLMPDAQACSLEQRVTSTRGLIKRLAALDKTAAADFQTQLDAVESQVQDEGIAEALRTVEVLEPQVWSALICAQGGDDGPPASQDDKLPDSDKFKFQAQVVKAGLERIRNWPGVDTKAAQFSQWQAAYDDALEKAKRFEHAAAVALLAGVESGIATAERVRTELDVTLPWLRTVLTAAAKAGEVGTEVFTALDGKLKATTAALGRLQVDEARQKAQALQSEVVSLKGQGRLYAEAATAVRGLLDAIQKDIDACPQQLKAGSPSPRAEPTLKIAQAELDQLSNEFKNNEVTAGKKGPMAGYEVMTKLEARIRSRLRAAAEAGSDDTTLGDQMVLKVKLELDNIRKSLPMIAKFDALAGFLLEQRVAGVEEALESGPVAAQTEIAPVIAMFKEIVPRMQAAMRARASTHSSVPGGPTALTSPSTPRPAAVETTAQWVKRVGDFRRYKLGPVLGGGARGTARLMTDPNDPSAPVLVVKQISKGTEQVYQEAENYKKLGDHPNIARCLGVREVEGEKAIVLEAVQGRSAAGLADALRARLAVGEIRPDQYWSTVQYTMTKMLEGIVHMHRAGFTHNDIKPDNVMIDKFTGEVKLIDMGGVEAIGQAYGKRSETTEGYTAPERFKQSTPQTDAFSAGASAYDMAEGEVFDYKAQGDQRKDPDYAALAKVFAAPAEAMTLADDANPLARQVDAKGRDLDPGDDDPGATAIKEAGRYGARTAYVDFLNALMNPDPNKRLSPGEALQHPFLRDRMLDDDEVKAFMKRALGPSEVPTQGKEPGRERFDTLFTGTGSLMSLSNMAAKLVDGTLSRDEARVQDVASIPAAGLIDERERLTIRLNNCRQWEGETQEPMHLLQRIVDAAAVTNNERHVEDLKVLDMLRRMADTFADAASHLQDRLGEIDARVANGDLLAAPIEFSADEAKTRAKALANQRQTLARHKSDAVDRPSAELSQQIMILARCRDEALALKQQAMSESAMMQSVRQSAQAVTGPSAARAQAYGANASTLLSDLAIHVTEIDRLKAEVETEQAKVKAAVAKIAGELDVVKRGLGSLVIKITAQFQKEDATASALEQAAKKSRSTAVEVVAFENARAQFEADSQAHRSQRQIIRALTEKTLAQLRTFKTRLGPQPMADFPTLLEDIDVEIGRLTFEPRLFSES